MAQPQALHLVAFRISSLPFNAPKPRSVLAGCNLVLGFNKNSNEQLGPRNCISYSFFKNPLLGLRSFSTSNSSKAAENSNRQSLPWLAASAEKERRNVVKSEVGKGVRSAWEESAEKFLKSSAPTMVESEENRKFEARRNNWSNKDDIEEEDKEDEEGEDDVVKDPRWHKIKNRFSNFAPTKPAFDKPEFRRWNNQETWGKKTWKEAKESTMPKLIGEGIYGVGPVLAALSANRREFYALYIQEGLDLSSNNNKKKDKKGFEKVLKMAEKIGLSTREVSKHDLNMVSDNRPHQGLILDASPLEMVGIKELEPTTEFEKPPLWLALDEVTDPQNLGAIIRSAYFFGASGVVLCAKNSAPLSGVVSKASAGSLELTELRSCKNMMQFLASSAKNGWRVIGASVSRRAVPLSEIEPGVPTILVLGSEGTGLRPLVERSCSELTRIPGNFQLDLVTNGYDEEDDVNRGDNLGREYRSFLAVESLNVSVAAGVLLHHLIGSDCSSNVQEREA